MYKYVYIYIYLYILLSLTSNDSNPQAPYDDWFRAGNWTELDRFKQSKESPKLVKLISKA